MVNQPQDVHLKHKELIDEGYLPGEIKNFEALNANWTAFYHPIGNGIDLEVTCRIKIN